MKDYQGNSKKAKEEAVVEKKVEKVVTGEVVTKSKPLGRKFKDIFMGADFKGAVYHVGSEVLIPAFRNMVVDATTKGIERMMFGETTSRSRRVQYGSRFSYDNPMDRSRTMRPRGLPPGRPTSRQARDEIVLSDRAEAELVLERMNDVLDSYEVVTVADLNDLLGLVVSHVDHKWGWVSLAGSSVRQIREGYLLDLPPAEPV